MFFKFFNRVISNGIKISLVHRSCSPTMAIFDRHEGGAPFLFAPCS